MLTILINVDSALLFPNILRSKRGLFERGLEIYGRVRSDKDFIGFNSKE